jgi:hypothetical protein
VTRAPTSCFRLALVLAALVVVLAACSGGDDSGDEGGGVEMAAEGDGGGSARTSVQKGEGAAEGGADVVVSARLGSIGPRIVQSASLRLTVPKDGLEDAVARARTVAVGLGGFVVSSSVRDLGAKRPTGGSLVVRVPVRNYARAMSSLSDVGRIVGREESGEDVSQEFVDLEARARHLEAVERQLLELLGRAQTVSAALAVQSQLNATQLELEQARGRLRFLEDQTAFATISLALRERGALPGSGRDRDWGIVDAWGDGARAFTTVAGKIFVVLAGSAPLLLLFGLGVLAVPALRRRVLPPWGVSRP